MDEVVAADDASVLVCRGSRRTGETPRGASTSGFRAGETRTPDAHRLRERTIRQLRAKWSSTMPPPPRSISGSSRILTACSDPGIRRCTAKSFGSVWKPATTAAGSFLSPRPRSTRRTNCFSGADWPGTGATVTRKRGRGLPGRSPAVSLSNESMARPFLDELSIRDTPGKARLPLYELRPRCDARPV